MNTDSFHKQIADILCQLDGTSIDFEDFVDATEMGLGWNFSLMAIAARGDHPHADAIITTLSDFILETDVESDSEIVSEAFRTLFIVGPLAVHVTLPVLHHCLQMECNSRLRYMAAEILWRITRNAELLLPVAEELLGDQDWRVRTEAAELLDRMC